ncbi:ribbon-helix-helix protein, CopG family [Streptomyces globisporus]|uniref:ribbon-helix-helix protein, CopG family n=1 Tax=Streptomyces TaxID=1883 RepID=UPI0027E5BA2F|nr:ribbon-helix-helix protein, CopG family [Streptomyces sp. PBSH9]
MAWQLGRLLFAQYGIRAGDPPGRRRPPRSLPVLRPPRDRPGPQLGIGPRPGVTLRLPEDLDAKLTQRARREGRSKQELAIQAIQEAQDRAELKVDDVLAELTERDAEILGYLK